MYRDNKTLMWLHYGARYYDPQLGRWWSVDPADEFHSPYTYVGNNPILYIDFFGMSSDENIPYWGYTETINVYGEIVLTLLGIIPLAGFLG